MKTEKKRKNSIISIAVAGFLIITIILTLGTLSLGRIAGNDTKEAVRNVSMLYLSELAGRREAVVSSILDDYVRDLDVAAGLLTAEDLSSIENLQAYQLKMKQLYDLDKFAFIDSNGLIYTSRGTRLDIDQYDIDYNNLSDPEISIKNIHSKDKKVVIAMPLDNLAFIGKTLVVCFMEIDMDNLLRNVSIQSNNNTTFCNIYTRDGIALTNIVLGGLSSEDNLISAMEKANYEKDFSYEQFLRDFSEGNSGAVSFSYNDINETLYYVPVQGTDWMLTYLIRESVIGEQINSISNSIILRSVIQSVLTALILLGMFILIFIQQKQASKAAMDREVSEAENRVKQQELEEQLAMQEELASKSEELAAALKSAEEANLAKSAFVSNMSHEIRTPITAILGMNEMIRRECNDENILSYSDNINHAGESLLGIISDILDFSKIEAGHMELTNESYSLPTLIGDVYNLVRFRAESKGLDLLFNVDRTLPTGLIGDELRVKQIITNLLTNGVKYTERGKVCLDITCEERDPDKKRVKLLIAVSDTGIGIHADEMDQLFVPFDRLDVSRNRTIEGTGLGLSISRQLLFMMNSELLVESIYNQGSKFYFSLWQGISDDTEIGDYNPARQPLTTGSSKADEEFFTAPGKRILVVDDTPMNLQVLTGLLKRTQMIVDTASGGEECIDKFGRSDYDIVFMDYRMPVMDGIETLRRLREKYPDKAGRVPIVALTASAILGDRDRLLAAGFTDYLSKPVVISDMEKMMTRYISDVKKVSRAETNETTSRDVSNGDDTGLPKGILAIAALDHVRGMQYCGDAEDYLYALETYAASVDEKAKKIEECIDSDNIEEYSLTVHSLKSMSRSIGALKLYDEILDLEKKAKSKDWEHLKTDTPKFLSEYRELGMAIKNNL